MHFNFCSVQEQCTLEQSSINFIRKENSPFPKASVEASTWGDQRPGEEATPSLWDDTAKLFSIHKSVAVALSVKSTIKCMTVREY